MTGGDLDRKYRMDFFRFAAFVVAASLVIVATGLFLFSAVLTGLLIDLIKAGPRVVATKECWWR